MQRHTHAHAHTKQINVPCPISTVRHGEKRHSPQLRQYHYSLSHFEAGTTVCEQMSNSLPVARTGEPSPTLCGKEKQTLLAAKRNEKESTDEPLRGLAARQGNTTQPWSPAYVLELCMLYRNVCVCVVLWSFWASPVLLIGLNCRGWGCSRWAWRPSREAVSTDLMHQSESNYKVSGLHYSMNIARPGETEAYRSFTGL